MRALVEAMAAECGPGVVALTRHNGSVTEAVAGRTTLDGPAPITAAHHFRIGSITKLATAAAVLQLVQEGRLSLDGMVDDLGVGASIPSIRHLLRMTSGIPDYLPSLVGDPPDLTQFQHAHDPRVLVRLALVSGTQPLGQFAYSNTNYLLLGLILEAVESRPWQQVVTGGVIDALGIANAAIPADMSLPAPHPTGYVSLSADQPATEFTAIHPTESGPSGAMVATAGDVLTLLDSIIRGELLADDLRDEMLEGIPIGPGRVYGLGAVGVELADRRMAWGHGGGVPGFMAFAYTTTDGDAAVVLRNHYAEWANISRWNVVADQALGPRRVPI